MTRSERALKRYIEMPDPYQVVNVGVIKACVFRKWEKYLQIYLILRGASCNRAGYFSLDDLQEVSRRMQLSMRTIKKHLNKLIEIDFIKYDGKKYRIRSLLYVMKLLNVKSPKSVVLEYRWLTFKPKGFQAVCMVALQSEFLSNRYAIMSKKGQITINDKKDKARVKIKLAHTLADHGGYRRPDQGEISLRLNQSLTGYSIGYSHGLKKIAAYYGLARYVRMYCPEFSKMNIKTRGELYEYLRSIGTPVGYDLRRFQFSTNFQKFLKIESDLCQIFLPVIRRNSLSGNRYRKITAKC